MSHIHALPPPLDDDIEREAIMEEGARRTIDDGPPDDGWDDFEPDDGPDSERSAIQAEPRAKVADSTKGEPARTDIAVRPSGVGGMVDATIRAIAARDIYQRGGTLADVTREATSAESADRVVRVEGSARIRAIPPARLHEVIRSTVRFTKQKKTFDAETEEVKWSTVETGMPGDLPAMVAARGEWQHIRPLAGIAQWPVMRPDGSILSDPGYDWRTSLLCDSTVKIAVPDRPTNEDARLALESLHDLFGDFPFAKPVYRTAAIAPLLTLLARAAIDGPTPMFVIDANERGSGKTLKADVTGMIVTGRSVPRRSSPQEEDEWRKALLGIAIAGDPLILLDNVTRMLRSASLDAVLTGTSYRDRVLGKNEELTLPWRTVMIATTNNATLSADLVRRTVHIRLDSKVERPEQRTDFRYPNLLAHARDHRARYLSDGLTILRAYDVAGRPAVEMRPMGSYEAWSSVVRASLIWAGEPDVALTQDFLRETADTEHETTGALMMAWHGCYAERAKTVRQVLDDVGDPDDRDPRVQALRDAIATLCDVEAGRLPTSRKLSFALRKLRGRIRGGFVFDRVAEHTEQGATWQVRQCG